MLFFWFWVAFINELCAFSKKLLYGKLKLQIMSSTINTSFDLYTELIGLYFDYLRKNKKAQLAISIISAILIIIFIGLRVFSEHIFKDDLITQVNNFLIGGLIFIILFFLITIASYSKVEITSGKIEIDLDGIRKEREEIKRKFSQKQDDVFNTIQLSLNQLTEYYTINLSQARSSYRWSIAAIIVGIITLFFGIWFFYFGVNPKIDLAIISGISGTILEFIGASNIYIYNKSLKQLNIYFRELITIQDTMLAIELCDKIEDSDKKTQIKEKIILSLMGRSSMRSEYMEDYFNHNRKSKSP